MRTNYTVAKSVAYIQHTYTTQVHKCQHCACATTYTSTTYSKSSCKLFSKNQRCIWDKEKDSGLGDLLHHFCFTFTINVNLKLRLSCFVR